MPDVSLDYEVAVVVNENGGNARDDIYFHDEATSGQVDKIWYGTADRFSFTPHTVSSPPTGVFDIQVGDFDGDAKEDLIWHSSSDTDYLLRGKTGGGMDIESLGDVVDGDRTALVGSFGDHASETGATKSDIFWHFNASRALTGPSTGNDWWWEE